MSSKLKVWYKYDKDYDPVFVNGAIGELNATGEAIIHFFSERTPLPRSVNVKFVEGSEDIVELDPVNLASSRIRMVKSGLVMNVDQLKELKTLIDNLLNDVKQ